MIKILSASQQREADAHTIENEPISSLSLMERAATRCTLWILENVRSTSKDHNLGCAVFCGPGNNGGDGLVIARKLHQAGWEVRVYVVRFTDKESDDFSANKKRCEEIGLNVVDIRTKEELPDVDAGFWVIDAIFGTGLSRIAEGLALDAIEHMNGLGRDVIAVDLPSGLFADDNRENKPEAVTQARFTLTFQSPKLAFFLPDLGWKAGDVHVLDIGLDRGFLNNIDCKEFLFTKTDARALRRKRSIFDHKNVFGHALLCGGSKGKYGAVCMSLRGALRGGAGLATGCVPENALGILQQSVPEAMAVTGEEADHLRGQVDLKGFKAIGVGPGMGTHEDSAGFLKVLIQETPAPLIIDADALNILAENRTWLSFLPKGCILTPHPGEFQRLVGKWDSETEKLELLRDLARKTGAVVVLKGAYTAVCDSSGMITFNTTGNPGMATGGSGDILTGIITGLVSQGLQAEHAARLGVFIHGLAGDKALSAQSFESMTAPDLLDFMGRAWNELDNTDHTNEI